MEPLSKLKSLTELLLIGYDFAIMQPRLYPMVYIKKLTVAGKISEATENDFELLKDFRTEHDTERPRVNRLSVCDFCEALFDQFPNLTQLTLIGNVYQHQLTHQRLTAALGDHFHGRGPLRMYFRNKNDPKKRAMQTRRRR